MGRVVGKIEQMATATYGALSARWTNPRMACLRDSQQSESKLDSD
jgi:hypothetical protein